MKKTYKYLLYMFLLLPIFYIFTWIHEGGHALSAILTGNEVVRIDVSIFEGCCRIRFRNWSIAWISTIMGSISTLIVAIPLFIYSIIKKNQYIFFISSIQIGKETLYWGISPFIKYGDAYLLIEWATYYRLESLIMFIYVMAIIFLIITLFVNITFYYFRIKWAPKNINI